MTPEQSQPEAAFEDVRYTCALLARTKSFAELTLRHKIPVEVATACSAELYAAIQSLRIDQIEKKKVRRR